MKLLSKKAATTKTPFAVINKQELKEVKGGAILIVTIENLES